MTVKVKRDRPSRRLHHRVTAPLFATVDGHRMRAADWSLGGLRIENFPGTLPAPGDTVELHISLPFQGFDVAFDCTATAVRNDPENAMFAVQFNDLADRESELMSHFIEEIVRGSMVDVEDTIQRIDVPVTPVSTKPDPNPGAELPARRIPAKTIVMSAMYLALGFVVFGYLGVMIYANYFRMEVQTAVISAPLEAVKAQFAGRIVWSRFRPGQYVRTGDILLHVADNDLEKEIDFAEIEVRERRAKLNFLHRRQLDELARVEGLAEIEIKRVKQTRLEIEALAAELQAAEALKNRLNGLLEDGYTTRQRAEEAEAVYVRARKQLESRQLELKAELSLARKHMGQRHYTGTNFVGEIGRIDAEVELAERRIGISSKRHQLLLKHRARLAVRAPFEGILLELPRVDLASVRHGETVAIIEQRKKRHITAYLKQDEILKVGLGERAYGYIPALNETVPLIVSEIDRTDGFIDEQHSSYKWRGKRDRTAKVVLNFEHPGLVRDAERYRSGLPVVVLFNQRSTNQLLAEVKHRLKLMFIGLTLDGGPLHTISRDPSPTPARNQTDASPTRREASARNSATTPEREQMTRLLGLRPDGRLPSSWQTLEDLTAQLRQWFRELRDDEMARNTKPAAPTASS